jgi:hypothetical protein
LKNFEIIKYPSYQKNEFTPELDTSASGIVISSVPTLYMSERKIFPLFGSFSIPKKLASDFQESLFQAVVILLRGPFPATQNIGVSEIFFEEDLLYEGENVIGHFNVDLFELFNLEKIPNRYYINASIFEFVSDIIETQVEK